MRRDGVADLADVRWIDPDHFEVWAGDELLGTWTLEELEELAERVEKGTL